MSDYRRKLLEHLHFARLQVETEPMEDINDWGLRHHVMGALRRIVDDVALPPRIETRDLTREDDDVG